MGTTSTSLHVLSAVVGVGSRLPEDVEKAYRKFGYARPKKAGGDATKRVILAPDASGDWLSIHDSDNDQIDTGELKQLAVELTKKLGTVALLTSVYDSDSFEFVMFHNGKQVDAAVSNPEGHAGGLKMLKGKRRAQAWYSMFIGRDLRRAVLGGRQGKLREDWEERLKTPPISTTPFAEDELGAWCTLAGLSPAVCDDGLRRAGLRARTRPGFTTLVLERATPKPAKATAAPTGTTLAYYRSDDDCPYLRFSRRRGRGIPACRTKNSGRSCAAAGASRACASAFAVEGPTPVQLERVYVRALPFYNGQITSLTSIAEHEWLAPDPGAVCPAELLIEIPGFVVPAADPQSRKLVILILIVQTTLPQEGEATLAPSVETVAGVRPSPALPPLRLRALRPAWVPLVSRSDTPTPRGTRKCCV